MVSLIDPRAIRATVTKFFPRRVRMEENIATVSAAVNNVENVAEGLGCEAFQNTTVARNEAERSTVRKIHFLSINYVQRRSSFFVQWVRK